MRDALLAAYAGRLVAPPRAAAPLGGGRMVLTAGHLAGEWYGFRSYDTFGHPQSEQLVVLHDGRTGAVRAVAVGEELGSRRTGGLGGVAVDALARPDAATLGVIGSGGQAWTQVWAAAAVRPLREVTVHSRSAARREAFAARVRAELGVPARAVATAGAPSRDRDVVVLATTSPTPVLAAADLAPARTSTRSASSSATGTSSAPTCWTPPTCWSPTRRPRRRRTSRRCSRRRPRTPGGCATWARCWPARSPAGPARTRCRSSARPAWPAPRSSCSTRWSGSARRRLLTRAAAGRGSRCVGSCARPAAWACRRRPGTLGWCLPPPSDSAGCLASDLPSADGRRVALLTLGCARNEVDSEELAARLHADGWQVTTDGEGADVVVVNTCGFVEKAKQDSIQTLLAAADTGAKVVAAGCMAERYGRELADSLPEAQAVLSFDDYPDIAARLDAVVAGEPIDAHTPRDRRELLPLTPVDPAGQRRCRCPGTAPSRAATETDEHTPAHLRQVLRRRLDTGPVASLKLASGCDRRCAFCAIPAFRGAFVSRTPDELLAEAEWLAKTGVRELVLVSENSTSYGKDLGDPRALEKLLPQLAAVDRHRPGAGELPPAGRDPARAGRGDRHHARAWPPYFDLSFQHSSEPVLRRMRRFGSTDRFLELLASARALAPEAGARSNFIVGFPGETRADVDELVRFLTEARLDAIGMFDYSDEDGTEAAGLPGKVSAATIKRRYDRLSALADELCSQRAEDRLGSTVEVLVDSVDDGVVEGRAAHQAPEVDGSTTLVAPATAGWTWPRCARRPGARDGHRHRGVDLVAVPDEMISAAPGAAR